MTNEVTVRVCKVDAMVALDDPDDLFSEVDLDMDDVREAAQKAQNATTNDEEIDLLREALEAALHALGLVLPESEDDDG